MSSGQHESPELVALTSFTEATRLDLMTNPPSHSPTMECDPHERIGGLLDSGTSRSDLPAGIANANGHYLGLSRHREGAGGNQREITLSWIIGAELGNCDGR